MVELATVYLVAYFAFNTGMTAMLYYDLDFRRMSLQSRIAGVFLSAFFALPILIWSIFYVRSEVKRKLDEMDK